MTCAVDLDAVTGVVHDRNVGITGRGGESDDRLPKPLNSEIIPGFDHVEACGLEQCRNRCGIVGRAPQRSGILVRRVADHKRDAF